MLIASYTIVRERWGGSGELVEPSGQAPALLWNDEDDGGQDRGASYGSFADYDRLAQFENPGGRAIDFAGPLHGGVLIKPHRIQFQMRRCVAKLPGWWQPCGRWFPSVAWDNRTCIPCAKALAVYNREASEE
jgi:hypothetical protein